MTTVSVAGASGYAGGELLRLVATHPHLTLGPVAAASRAGESLAAVHPNLTELADLMLVEADAAILGEADLVFLALPHGQSASIVRDLPEDVLVVDLGADFRLLDPADWTRYYGGTHAGTWAYGLPELLGQRTVIAGSHRVANPGCYATAVALALAPVLRAGLADPSDVVVVAASGTSGAGRKASDALLASQVMGSMSAYKVGGTHQHTPEMEQSLSAAAGVPVTLGFTPLLAPMPRGIVATCTAVATGTADEVRAALVDAYEREPFVHVLPEGHWPQTSSVSGSNMVHLQCAVDEHSGRVIVISAIDNLVKGAAGQAIQNANILLGIDETAGLSRNGVAP
jgi:N-acetyl-gamma-glutamyl-phosphate reductase